MDAQIHKTQSDKNDPYYLEYLETNQVRELYKPEASPCCRIVVVKHIVK